MGDIGFQQRIRSRLSVKSIKGGSFFYSPDTGVQPFQFFHLTSLPRPLWRKEVLTDQKWFTRCWSLMRWGMVSGGQSQYSSEKAGKWSEWSRIYRIPAPNSSFELFVRRYEPTKTVISNNYKIKLKITIKTKFLWAEKTVISNNYKIRRARLKSASPIIRLAEQSLQFLFLWDNNTIRFLLWQ